MNTYVNVKTQKRFPVQGYAEALIRQLLNRKTA
jgi:hypothetical protein